ncbi:MAG: Septum site-determining protein MinC [Candidatus Carbobacillus altaicus]|uniref:Probable septum site-determining protein MinC n=1 Tax=Candidatus Carbonibacillus altaicus TaxID=2163959 RepID=A0A2R6Y228_9BACL|nr:MAG: Septum site-determining protein MinC [Candidatus Carbobacillus altaicus]
MALQDVQILIKGSRDGLSFFLDPHCSFDDLLSALEARFMGAYDHFLQGPPTEVHVHFGTRYVTEEQIERVRTLIEQHGSLKVTDVIRDVFDKKEVETMLTRMSLKTEVGIVRSGQVVEAAGDVLLLGDLNPGGLIRARGSIYIFGQLMGHAFAGVGGDPAIIVAHDFRPTRFGIGRLALDEVPRSLYGKASFAAAHKNRLLVLPLKALRGLPFVLDEAAEEMIALETAGNS